LSKEAEEYAAMRVFWIWLCLVSIVVFAFLCGYFLSPQARAPALARAEQAASQIAAQVTGETGTDEQISTPSARRATTHPRISSATRSDSAIILPVLNADSPKPDYPARAIARHEEGQVRLKVLVGTDGAVKEARILHSSGSDRLDWAAMTTALHQWRYQPGSRNGAPEAMWREMKVTFTCTADGRDNCDPNAPRTKHRRAVALERVSAR
jgi:TonB family protein